MVKKIVIIFLRIIAKFIVFIIGIFTKHAVLKEIIGNELARTASACIHGLRKSTSAEVTNFKTLDKTLLPNSFNNFEDLVWLFNCNYANRGIITIMKSF
jgi:hypothetical protein